MDYERPVRPVTDRPSSTARRLHRQRAGSLRRSSGHIDHEQSLGQRRTHLLSVSKTGELAVLTNVKFLAIVCSLGTLARMTMDGGARPLMEQVREADWSP
jgi:hypothetical protein